MTNLKICSLLDEYQKNNHLSGRAFAKQIGISQTYLSNIKKGTNKPSFKVLHKISQATGIKLEKLLKTVLYDEMNKV